MLSESVTSVAALVVSQLETDQNILKVHKSIAEEVAAHECFEQALAGRERQGNRSNV